MLDSAKWPLAVVRMVLLPSAVAFPLRQLVKLCLIIVQATFLLYFAYAAYDIRLHAIRTFGHIIHEFDPWFNYRAAEYLAQHGLSKFFKWYDYMSWYPIGRPIGTTIYPGMQMWAVGIWEVLKHVPERKVPLPFIPPLRPVASWARRNGWPFIPSPLKSTMAVGPMSVNDICCMIPPWFGSVASIFTGLLAYEISRSVNAGLMATGIMAVIPAHIMRSVGGKFDNEAVAMTAICMTFWLWLLSIRSPRWWPVGIFTGLSYINMVAAWGGYIFVLNMIGVHAVMLVLLGRFNSGAHKAYSLFYIIGTAGAVQIPVVGWQPLRSLEQMGPLLVFVGYQVLAFCDYQRHRKKMDTWAFVKYRILMCFLTGLALIAVAVMLYPTGYFGPLSSRIRGLFVKHTKTGNPLVDSVAEHQPANPKIYASHLGLPLNYVLFGGLVSAFNRNNGFYFLCLYGFILRSLRSGSSLPAAMDSVLSVFREADVEKLPRRRVLQLLQMMGAEKMETFVPLLDAYAEGKASPAESEDIRLPHFLAWLRDPCSRDATQEDPIAAERNVVDALAHRGVTLRSLVAFMRRLPEAMPHYDLDTTRTVDVVWQVIIPETAEKGCSYADLLQSSEKRLPDKMVSHNWRNLFSHLMAALFADAAGKTSFRTVLSWMRLGSPGWDLIEAEVQDAGQLDSSRWLCIFAVNQHVSICDKTWGGKDSLLGRPYIPCGCRKEKVHSGIFCEMNKFDAMIALFKERHPRYEHVVAVDDGLHVLTRIWVIAEIAEVFRNRLPCKVVLLQPRGIELLSRVKEMDVRDAQASRPEDVHMILEKIVDKTEFNERTRSALMKVAYLASLELRVEMRYQLRGISSQHAEAEFMRHMEMTRQKLKEASSFDEVQLAYGDFEEQTEQLATDEDQTKLLHFCDLLQNVDLMQPELFIRTYREAAIPESGFRLGMTDKEVLQVFWAMRASVRSMHQLPHVYVNGPAVLAALAKLKQPQASVICVTCTNQSEHVVFGMGKRVQMTEPNLATHMVTLVHRSAEEGACGATIYRGFDETPGLLSFRCLAGSPRPSLSYQGPFTGEAVASFVVEEALPLFGVLHEANRVHYLVKARAGLLTVWLGPCGELQDDSVLVASAAIKQLAARFPDIPCCLLNSAFLDADVLTRFLHTSDTRREEDGDGENGLPTAVAVLFLGQLSGRRACCAKLTSEALKRFVCPLQLPLRSAERLQAFVEGALDGTLTGEDISSTTPLLGETFAKKLDRGLAAYLDRVPSDDTEDEELSPASHFSGKMSRLVLICGPIVSVACGIWCGFLLDMIVEPFLLLLGKKGYGPPASAVDDTPKSGKGKAEKDKGDKSGKDKDAKKKRSLKEQVPELEEHEEELRPGGAMQLKRMFKGYCWKMLPENSVEDVRAARYAFDSKPLLLLFRAAASIVFVGYMLTMSELRSEIPDFVERCKAIGEQVASPTVMYAVRQKDASNYIVDDYYKGYKWLEKNTAEDARVMAWWDYGYQITGIGNRTSIADGNTWNHEHIATLGRTLTSEVKRAHNAIRHLADYVLVWGGGQRDDLGKSPHLARIGNSVFPDHCGDDDPKCTKFGFYADRSPTPMMEKSLLYKLVEHSNKKGVRVNERYFKHVHTTKHGLMRIYEVQNVSQESKDWIADPQNRVCDAPGSWYCVGQYPPALSKLIAKRRNFAQIEDFNKKGEKSAYTRLIEKEKGEL
eukprot:s519_g36.t1